MPPVPPLRRSPFFWLTLFVVASCLGLSLDSAFNETRASVQQGCFGAGASLTASSQLFAFQICAGEPSISSFRERLKFRFNHDPLSQFSAFHHPGVHPFDLIVSRHTLDGPMASIVVPVWLLPLAALLGLGLLIRRHRRHATAWETPFQ